MLAGCGPADRLSAPEPVPESGPAPVVIGFSMGGIRMERWKKDEQIIVRLARERGAQVISFSANDNPELQNDQAENLIIQGVDVLLVVPYDGEKSARIVEMAHRAGIPVIAYDRIIRNCELDYYVSFDNEKVGEYQAQGVLDALDPSRTNRLAYIGGSPLDNNSYQLKRGAMRVIEPEVAQGRAIVVLETFTRDWSSQNAYVDLREFLAAGGRVDGVVAANDATASGVVQALREQGLAGIPVSGQDADLAACRRLVEGTQQMTVYKPLERLGAAAVELALQVARGGAVPADTTVNNGACEVPTILLESVPVTRANLDETVVRDGFHSRASIYGHGGGGP